MIPTSPVYLPIDFTRKLAQPVDSVKTPITVQNIGIEFFTRNRTIILSTPSVITL
jgi:hypothetical protein